ncbi:hypothetical protein BA190_26930 [Labrys sp. WJW]|uniref:class I SAM-dependent methyltransferase n=1 Tax=Labrys sp. WJW TaxID=1737983 RepID=UPI00082D20E2|nr:class I SAM-dependent methyltransferase [Labrys sp. WJW]OCC01850.1 hypothetical protein BA190_26930 [Labrys sp. WJW]
MDDDLTKLAKQHGTDKATEHRYTQHYHRHFSALRDDPVRLLEIGIGGYGDPNAGGHSLRMWREYFPKGQIVGLDYHPKPGVASDRIKTYHGSQGDPRAIAQIIDEAEGNQFDIIIDDGSHRPEHVIPTFWMLFQFVAPNGWYVVEDVQTSYWPIFGSPLAPATRQITTMEFFKSLIDGLNWEEMHAPAYSPTYTDLNVFGMHFYHNLIFIQKGDNREGSNFVKGNKLPWGG